MELRLHIRIDITGSNNIIIRNIEFDEIWEWDDYTEGAYDRNDWDYMTIEKEALIYGLTTVLSISHMMELLMLRHQLMTVI